MSDHHETLTAEYERLCHALDGPMTQMDVIVALQHILRRLGPPTLTEASDIEFREASGD